MCKLLDIFVDREVSLTNTFSQKCNGSVNMGFRDPYLPCYCISGDVLICEMAGNAGKTSS